MQHGHAPLAGGDELDVVVTDRRAHDDGVGSLLVRLVEADPDAGALALEGLEDGHVLGVAAGDPDAAGEHDAGHARHPGAPDGEEVHAAEVGGVGHGRPEVEARRRERVVDGGGARRPVHSAVPACLPPRRPGRPGLVGGGLTERAAAAAMAASRAASAASGSSWHRPTRG